MSYEAYLTVTFQKSIKILKKKFRSVKDDLYSVIRTLEKDPTIGDPIPGWNKEEMPQGNPAGVMSGFQLWANLSASHKMIALRYQEFKIYSIPMLVVDQSSEATRL